MNGSPPRRCAARPTLIPKVAEIFGAYTREALLARLKDAGLPHADVATPEGMSDDEHLEASNGLVTVTVDGGREVRVPALPIAFGGERLTAYADLPTIGQHGPELLAELGYDESAIGAMQTGGVLSVGTGKR